MKRKGMNAEQASRVLEAMDPEMRKRIVDALNRTFDTIHSDLATALAEGEGRDGLVEIDDPEIMREAAADYVHMYHRDPEAYAAWEPLDYKVKDMILALAFPDRPETRRSLVGH